MVPVSLFVDGVRVGRIYDLVRGKFLDRGGELAEFDITGVPSVKTRVTASAAQGYESSSSSAITVTGIDGGYISVAVRAAAADLRLVLAYGASDAGTAISDWNSVIAVAALEQGETKLKVPLPDGWGSTVTALRFFAVNFESYLESSGTQYIDTCWTNGSNHVVEMVFQPRTQSTSNAKAFYGCRNGADSRNILMFADNRGLNLDFNNGNYGTYRLDKVSFATSGYQYRMLDSAARRVAEWSKDGVVAAAKTNATVCADNFTCAGSAYLFAANDMSGGSPAVLWSGNGLLPIRFYSLRVWTTGGTLVSEIIPIKVNGVAKAYDTVRGIYLENAGSGDFNYVAIESGPPSGVSDLITPQTKFYTGFMVIVH